MTGFQAERRYKPIISELDEFIHDLEFHTEQKKKHSKMEDELKGKIKSLAKEKQKLSQYKLPADYLR